MPVRGRRLLDVVGGGRLRVGRRRHDLLVGRVGRTRFDSAAGVGPVGRPAPVRPSSPSARGACLRGRGLAGRRGQVARGRGRSGAAGTAARAAAGADRDDDGVVAVAAAGFLRHGRPPPATVGATRLAEVGERLGRGELRLEAEHGAHPGGVHASTVGQEPQLLGREVRDAGLAHGRAEPTDREARQRDRRRAEASYGLAQRHHPVAGDVEGAGHPGGRGVAQHPHQVVLVEELQPRVEAEDPGDHREPEVVGQRARDVGPDHVGGPDHRDVDVGAPAGEPADVALDLVDVLGVARGGQALGTHVLGEHRGVTRTGAVDGGRRLHDQPLDGRRLLARSEQLHGADDVELLHRPATTGRAGGRDHAHVDDGVDVLLRDDLRDDRVADVGADEGDVADVTARRDRVHADDSIDGRVAGRGAREASSDVPGDPGDQHDPPHGRGVLLAELAALHARLLEQLAVLLLGHALAPLLDDRTHESDLSLRPTFVGRTRTPYLAGCGQRGIASDQWIPAGDERRQPAL